MNRVAEQPPRVSRRVLMLALAFLGLLAFAALAATRVARARSSAFRQARTGALASVDASSRRWLRLLSDPGEPQAVLLESFALAALVCVAVSRRCGRRRFARGHPSSVSVVAELVLKPVIDRRTMGGAGLHFPSGHSTGVTSVATAAWLAYVSMWRSRSARAAGGACLVVVVIGVGCEPCGAARALRDRHRGSEPLRRCRHPGACCGVCCHHLHIGRMAGLRLTFLVDSDTPGRYNQFVPRRGIKATQEDLDR